MKDISWNLNENRALENFSGGTLNSRYNWAKALESHPSGHTSITINLNDGTHKRALTLSEVAQMLGSAIDRLNATRGKDENFSPENLSFVGQATLAFLEKIQALTETPLMLTEQSLLRMLEKTLVELDAHDIARSLLIGNPPAHSTGLGGSLSSSKVIRRNGQVVPWNTDKIEIATRKAFLAQMSWLANCRRAQHTLFSIDRTCIRSCHLPRHASITL
jgi:ribonucleoside-diphosphate reductase alpha chain